MLDARTLSEKNLITHAAAMSQHSCVQPFLC